MVGTSNLGSWNGHWPYVAPPLPSAAATPSGSATRCRATTWLGSIEVSGLFDGWKPSRGGLEKWLIQVNNGLLMVNNDYYLVGGLEHGFYFPFHIWDVIRNPLMNSIIFQRGRAQPPTSQFPGEHISLGSESNLAKWKSNSMICCEKYGFRRMLTGRIGWVKARNRPGSQKVKTLRRLWPNLTVPQEIPSGELT